MKKSTKKKLQKALVNALEERYQEERKIQEKKKRDKT